MTIYDKINRGDFAEPDYPTRPARPAILDRNVVGLADEELAAIPSVRKQFAADMAAYEHEYAKSREESNKASEAFRVALAEEHGIAADSPAFEAMYKVAWERGHSSGYHEVASIFDDLMPIYEAATRERSSIR